MTLTRSGRSKPGRLTSWSRAAALAVAGVTSLALTLDPYILNGASVARLHEGLPLLMLGVSTAFAYGLGFQPASKPICALIHPATGSALLVAGTMIIFVR